MKILTCTLLALLAAPAAAADAGEARLKRATIDGMQLEYSISRDRKGREVLTGHELATGKRFRFIVSKGRVRGDVDGRPVAFHVSEAEREAEASRRAAQ